MKSLKEDGLAPRKRKLDIGGSIKEGSKCAHEKKKKKKNIYIYIYI